jgi:cytoskeletal protein CcmA (bactofilin family)
MSDIHVRRGETATLDRVEGELKIGNNARIEASNGKNVVITKGVYLEGKAYVNCDLECDSLESKTFLSKEITFKVLSNKQRLEVTGRSVGRLEMNGNLNVHKQLNVSHTVQIQGSIKAEDIDVGGRIQADAVNCSRIRVGGRADIKNTLEASSVEVGGKIVAGVVKIGDLNVGGEAEVNGGSITGNIRVRGKFISKSPLEFGELLVYGRGSLPANCKGHRLSTFGKINIDGNITCNFIQVSGVVEVLGDCHADRIEVGGKFEVSGSLFVADRLEGFGATSIAGNFDGKNFRFGGKFQANKITVSEEADVSGKVETKEGFKAKQLNVRSGTQIDGALVGELVEIGKSPDLSYGAWAPMLPTKFLTITGGNVKVQDVYAQEVLMGTMCKAARIFADTVNLEQGCTVEQVMYTKDLKTGFGVAICQPPQKVTNLPPAPF